MGAVLHFDRKKHSHWVMTQRSDFRVKQPLFQFETCYLLVIWPWKTYYRLGIIYLKHTSKNTNGIHVAK
jgi:hypothetical protein